MTLAATPTSPAETPSPAVDSAWLQQQLDRFGPLTSTEQSDIRRLLAPTPHDLAQPA